MTITPAEWIDIVNAMDWFDAEERQAMIERFAKLEKRTGDDEDDLNNERG